MPYFIRKIWHFLNNGWPATRGIRCLSVWKGVKVHGTAENRRKREKEKEPVQDERASHYADTGSTVHHFFAYLPIFGLVMAFQDFKPLMGFRESLLRRLTAVPVYFTMPSFRTAFVNTMIISFLRSF